MKKVNYDDSAALNNNNNSNNKKNQRIAQWMFSKSFPFSHVAFGERNEERGMLLSEDTGVIKLFTVSKNVETMRLAASSGTL